MSLTPIEQVRLEIGLVGDAATLISDSEIEYFLNKSNNSVRIASLDVAKTVLFILSQQIRERTGIELEIYGNQWFTQYKEALQMYIREPSFNTAMLYAKVYAGGISKTEIRQTIDNPDIERAMVEKGIPTEYYAFNVNNPSEFQKDNFSTSSFIVGNVDPFKL